MNIFIIIPAYNEEKMIESVVNEVKKFGRVVVVNDDSSDSTNEIAQEAGAAVLSHIVNRGQGAALQTGMNYALENNADVVIHFDADGQHCAQDIERLIEPILLDEVDVVLGSRFLCKITNYKIPFLRYLILKVGVVFTRFISGINVTDTHNGFRALSRKAAEKIQISQDRMAHASEILDEVVKNNLTYKEVAVQVKYTSYSKKKGQNSLNFINILKELITGKVLR